MTAARESREGAQRAREGGGDAGGPAGIGGVDARASVERAVELVETSTSFGIRGKEADEDVCAYRRRVRDALTVSSAKFDGKLFLAARGERGFGERVEGRAASNGGDGDEWRAREERVRRGTPADAVGVFGRDGGREEFVAKGEGGARRIRASRPSWNRVCLARRRARGRVFARFSNWKSVVRRYFVC